MVSEKLLHNQGKKLSVSAPGHILTGSGRGEIESEKFEIQMHINSGITACQGSLQIGLNNIAIEIMDSSMCRNIHCLDNKHVGGSAERAEQAEKVEQEDPEL